MSKIKWSYAINQWRPTYDTFVRREQHERAFKTLSASGFDSIEINCGPGRWEPLGNREMIEANHGSVAGLKQFLASCGIKAVSSYFLDPGAFIGRSDAPLSAANPQHLGEIVELAQGYIELLPQLGGDRLIVRAAPAYWRAPGADAPLIENLAKCWNALAHAAQHSEVKIGLHLDCLSAIRTQATIESLLKATDPSKVGLAIDTAECTIAGLDPVELLNRFAPRVNHLQLKDVINVDEFDEYRLPHAEMQLLSGGGRRGIERWFYEMGVAGGRVDFPAVVRAAHAHGYQGFMVIESDQSPYPATSAMLNGWYVKHKLASLHG